ncbi:peptidase domain-containing ABC transporter [Magnetococcales bacterium HHB-1]
MEKKAAFSTWPRWRENGLDLLFATLLINLLSLALPLTLMQVYDRIILFGSVSTLGWLVFGCLVALLIETLLRLGRSWISAWMAAKLEHRVSMGVVKQILSCRLFDYEREGLGVHLDRINAVPVLREFYAGQIFQVLLDLPFSLLFFVAMAYLGGWLVWIPVISMALFGLLVFFFQKRFEMARLRQSEVNDRRFNYILETLGGIHLLKSLNLEEQMLRRHERLQAGMAEDNLRTTFWSSVPVVLGFFFTQGAMLGVVLAGAAEVIQGSMTVGSMAACSLLSSRATQPLQALAALWIRMTHARIARDKLAAVEKMEPEVAPDAPSFPKDIEGEITLKGVSFRYQDDLPWLFDDLSLSIKARSIVSISAAGAEGGTTLLQMMMGLFKPQKGEVLIDDYSVTEWDRSDMHGCVEYLPDRGVLFKGTILDNISMFDPNKRLAALDAAALLELDSLVSRLPMGYETLVTAQSNRSMPSGLIQRISVARALVERPRILLLDKTTSAMDQRSTDVVMRLLQSLKGQCTIVIVSQKSSLMALAEQHYLLTGGRLEAQDGPSSLF